MTTRRVKYNPSLLSEKTLVEQFVVRQTDLALITRVIESNTGGANQHVLVIGPRGSGKTTLMLRTAAEIRANQKLNNNWYPLVFSEESYEIASAGEFWLDALFHLAEQTDEPKWRETYAELKKESDDNILRERALSQLLDFADTQKKRIILVVENLNMLLDDLIDKDEAWKIRHTLINEPRLMLLASATSRFEGIDNAEHAMYEMFNIYTLPPLSEKECNAVWELVTGHKLEGERIRPIRILTGGNLRLLTIIAQFGAQHSFASLMDDLIGLIDDHTEYFKSHLDNLAPAERRVYLALAELWDYSTARDIAAAARAGVNETSALLRRLAGRNAVEILNTGKRTRHYSIAERMYNIYYLMRRRGKPADRVKAAVKFMTCMYDHESVTRLISEEADMLSPERRDHHYLAFAEILKDIDDPLLRERIVSETSKSFLDSLPDDALLHSLIATAGKEEVTVEENDQIHAYAEKFQKTMEELLAGVPESFQPAMYISSENFAADPLHFGHQALSLVSLLKGIALLKGKKYDGALEHLDEAISHANKTATQAGLNLRVLALCHQGNIHMLAGRYQKALEMYEMLDTIDENMLNVFVRENIDVAMYAKSTVLLQLGELESALATVDRFLQKKGKEEASRLAQLTISAQYYRTRLLTHMQRHNDALQAATLFLAWVNENSETYSKPERVAEILLLQAYLFNTQLRFDEASTTLQTLLSETDDPDKTIDAMTMLGGTLYLSGKSDQAFASFEKLAHRFQASNDPEIRKQVATSLAEGSNLFLEQNHLDQAERLLLHAEQFDPTSIDIKQLFINFWLRKAENHAKAVHLAKELISNHQDNDALLNNLAWQFYKRGTKTFLPLCEAWARQAVSLSPTNSANQHTLAHILATQGKKEEALTHAKAYLADPAFVSETIHDAITLFVELTASGWVDDALALLENTEAALHIEPLIVGLKLYRGDDVKSAIEIQEVAQDVVKRIEQRIQNRAS